MHLTYANSSHTGEFERLDGERGKKAVDETMLISSIFGLPGIANIDGSQDHDSADI